MALNFKTEGILHKIDPIQQITETFKKRNIVVEICDNPVYKEYVTFELVQEDGCKLVDVKKRNIVVEICDNPIYKEYVTFELIQEDGCKLVDDFTCGDKVEVFFSIRGREYQDKNSGEIKYFNTLRCWKISKINNLTSEEKPSSEVKSFSEEEDLPF